MSGARRRFLSQFFVSATGGDLNLRPRPADAARVSWRDARTPGPPRDRPVVCLLFSGCSSVQVQGGMDSGSAAAAAAAAAAAPTAAATGSPAEQRRTTGARPWGTAGRPSFGRSQRAGTGQLGVEIVGPGGLPNATATRGEVVSPPGLAIPRVRTGTPLSGAGRPTSPLRPPGAKPERPGLAALLFDRNPTSSHRHQHPPPLPSIQPATRSSPPRAHTQHSSLPRGESAAHTPSPAPTAQAWSARRASHLAPT